MSDVAGRAVLVTGGAGGIGQALVKAFVGAGMRVGVCDLNLAGAEKVAAQYGPDNAIAVEANVADPGACERAVARVADRVGDRALARRLRRPPGPPGTRHCPGIWR